MWVMNRSSKNKVKEQRHPLKEEVMSSCCYDNNLCKTADYKEQQQEPNRQFKFIIVISNINPHFL